jgi:predicted AAA+ superfamily ATPase
VLYNPAVGNAWEGYVIEQILQLLPATIQPYFYRTHDGSEMDLVLVKGIKPVLCIEIKTGNEPQLTRGFYECLKDLKCQNAFVITPHQQAAYQIDETVTVCGLHDFLTQKLHKFIK